MSDFELSDNDRELDLHLTDDQLRARTEELLAVASAVLPQLMSQTERLSRALDLYAYEVDAIAPQPTRPDRQDPA